MTDQPANDRPIPAPRNAEDEPWEHPADGGEPLDGNALWANGPAFGLLQNSEQFPDDLAQAMRMVFEKMHRAGFRDWDLDGDYVECSYWLLRRNLEVFAREAFRHWYGDEWVEPFRTACHLQETGVVEYRIDHLLQEMGVEIRKREDQQTETPSAEPPRMRLGYVTDLLISKAPEFMTVGEPMTVREIADELQKRTDRRIHPEAVYGILNARPHHFERRKAGYKRVCYALKPSPSAS